MLEPRDHSTTLGSLLLEEQEERAVCTSHGTIMRERHLSTHLSVWGQPPSWQGSQNRVHPMFLRGPDRGQ